MADIALFDLDRTLLDCNSGSLWVRHEWRGGRLSARDVAVATWWLLRYSLGSERGLDQAFAAAVERLRGLPEDELRERVEVWFTAECVHRLRPGARAAIEEHRRRGDLLVLATSTTPYAASAAASAYVLDEVICTRFEVEAGCFTGRIAELAAGAAKADRVLEWAERAGADLQRATFYTDSATDLALLEQVGRPVAVNPDRSLARIARDRGWEVVDWGRAGPGAVAEPVVD